MSELKKVVLALVFCVSWLNPCPSGAAATYSLSSLEPGQGRYFKWSSPSGWHVRESMSGVTITSPDNMYSASLALLLRSRGSRTPQMFLNWVLTNTPGFRNASIISVKNLPPQQLSFQVWQFIEARVSYIENGLPVTGVFKTGVANYAGLNDAMIVGYRAANDHFRTAQSFMPQIAKSIVLTNAAEASGNNTLVKPKNNPLDNTATIKSWENRQKSRDEALRKDANTRRGTVDLYDSSTGETLRGWSQHTNYYWRKPGSNEVVGTDTYNPPGVGYVPLTPR
jgi:hypothetical protein